MPTLNLKDPEVYHLAAELAARRGTSMTAAVKESLQESLERSRPSREGLAERLMEIGRRAAQEARANNYPPMLTDDDLYDENGLPH